MEEQEKNWVEKFSKDELIEDIQSEFATDARNNIGCGSFLLLFLVFNLFGAFETEDWSPQYLSFLAILLLFFIYDICMKKKMSKSEDAHQLVDMYQKYNKANRIFGYVAEFVLILYVCYELYSDFGEASMTRTLIYAALVVILIGNLIWNLFHKKDKRAKKPVDKEIDRLNDLLSKE